MGFCGIVAAFGVYAAHNAGIWNPTDVLQSLITFQGVIAAFILYSILSFTSALLYLRTPAFIKLRFASASLGSIMWIACLASSFQWVFGCCIQLKDGMNLLYFIPLMADTWVLIQIIAGVDNIDRRRIQ
jgi:ABC-type multidrug transport system permease subunit